MDNSTIKIVDNRIEQAIRYNQKIRAFRDITLEYGQALSDDARQEIEQLFISEILAIFEQYNEH